MDFPEEWRGLGFLAPSIPGPAMIAFVHAVSRCTYCLGEDRFDDIAATISIVKKLVDKYTDPLLSELLAAALINKGGILGELGRGDEAIAIYDDIVSRYGTASEPALRELVAKALFNKGGTLGALGRHDDAISVYDDLCPELNSAKNMHCNAALAVSKYGV
jgi:tetratricopeptide (TPR) repeat protein